MYITRGRKGRGGRGLGLVSTQVGNSLVFGSSPITRGGFGANPPRRIITTPIAPIQSPIVGPVSGQWSGVRGNGNGGRTRVKRRQRSSSSGWQQNQWGQSSAGWQNGGGSGWGVNNQNSQSSSQALEQAVVLYQTNPALLTQQQFTLLQNAGYISTTVPYSSVGTLTPYGSSSSALTSSSVAAEEAAGTYNDPNCVAAGCTGGPYPNCTCAASASSSLSESVGGFPLYVWLIGGVGLILILKKR